MDRPVLKSDMWVGCILPPKRKRGRQSQHLTVNRWFGKIIWAEQAETHDISKGVDVFLKLNDPNEPTPIIHSLFWDRYKVVTTDYGWDLCAPTDLVCLPYDAPFPQLSAAEEEVQEPTSPVTAPAIGSANDAMEVATGYADVVQRLTCDPTFHTWLKGFVQDCAGEILSSGMKVGKDENAGDDTRVFLRQLVGKKALCAWLTRFPQYQHDEGADKCHFVPLELFGDPKFKDEYPISTDAVANCKQYGICKTCHKMPSEKDHMFFDTKNRVGLCAVCKLVCNSQLQSNASRLPLCNNCVDSTKGGKFDTDREKQFLQRLFAPVQTLFPHMDVQIYPEYVVAHTGPSKGAGNWDKRIDCLITMSYPQQSMGRTVTKTVAIIIELDKDQKRFTAEDKEMETLRAKVKHVRNRFGTSQLYVWRVNLTGNYKMRVVLEPSELDLYERVVVLRKWLVYFIYNYKELPKMMVWYMWYDGDVNKETHLKNMYVMEDRPYIRVVNFGPTSEKHQWMFCVDPMESGEAATFEKMDNKLVQVDKNPFRHMKAHHQSPSLTLGALPMDIKGKNHMLVTLTKKQQG